MLATKLKLVFDLVAGLAIYFSINVRVYELWQSRETCISIPEILTRFALEVSQFGDK